MILYVVMGIGFKFDLENKGIEVKGDKIGIEYILKRMFTALFSFIIDREINKSMAIIGLFLCSSLIIN